jgi:uncharacterized membrane protein
VKRETLIAASVFAAIPVVILSAAILCTWGLAHGASPAWRLPFRLLCHGIPHRCLLMWGLPMPICARCTALYLGLFAGLVTFFVLPWIHEKVVRILMFAAAGAMAIDGLTQLARLRESTNELRLATGLALGFTFGMWVLSAIERRDLDSLTSP